MGPYRSNYLLSHLDVLEAESVHIMLEVAAESERPLRGRLSSPAILRGTSSVRPTTFPSGQLRLVRSRPRFPKDSNRKWCPAAPEWPAPGRRFRAGLVSLSRRAAAARPGRPGSRTPPREVDLLEQVASLQVHIVLLSGGIPLDRAGHAPGSAAAYTVPCMPSPSRDIGPQRW